MWKALLDTRLFVLSYEVSFLKQLVQLSKFERSFDILIKLVLRMRRVLRKDLYIRLIFRIFWLNDRKYLVKAQVILIYLRSVETRRKITDEYFLKNIGKARENIYLFIVFDLA